MRRWRRGAGLSLVEVLVSILILFVAVLAVIGIFPTMAKGNKGNINFTTAKYTAEQVLDDILRSDSIAIQDPDAPGVMRPNPDQVAKLPEGTVSWGQVNDPDSPASLGIRLVTVTVTWRENNRTRTVQLQSKIVP